jgi:phage anti-repressor protein
MDNIKTHYLEIDNDLFEILFKDFFDDIKVSISKNNLKNIWNTSDITVKLIQLFVTDSLNMHALSENVHSVYPNVVISSYLFYLIQCFKNNPVQRLFVGGMLIMQDNYNYNEYNDPSVLGAKTIPRKTPSINATALKKLIDTAGQATNDALLDSILSYTPPPNKADELYQGLLVKDLLSPTQTLGKLVVPSALALGAVCYFNLLPIISSVIGVGVSAVVSNPTQAATVLLPAVGPPVASAAAALVGNEQYSTKQGTKRGGKSFKQRKHRKHKTEKVRMYGGAGVEFLDWCVSKIDKFELNTNSSIAKKSVFVRTFITNEDIKIYRKSNIINNFIDAFPKSVKWFERVASTSPLASNDYFQKVHNDKLNDLRKKQQLLPVCFKNAKSIAIIQRRKKVEDDYIMIKEAKEYQKGNKAVIDPSIAAARAQQQQVAQSKLPTVGVAPALAAPAPTATFTDAVSKKINIKWSSMANWNDDR